MKKAAPKKRGPGRPNLHSPDGKPELVARAKLMAKHGMRRDDIAAALGIPRRSFYDNGWDKLLAGEDQEANAKVAETLFLIATDRDHPKCVTAAIWWEKTRSGFRETQELHHSFDPQEQYRNEIQRWAEPIPPEEVGRN